MNTRIHSLIGAVLLFLAAAGRLAAQVPQLINDQGRVVVGATNFNGTGLFKFALVNTDASTTFWSNDGTSAAGSEPATAVALTVSNGLYSVLLGDISVANMTAIPATVFSNSDVRLRVWFDDGVHGSQQLSPDQRIAAVGYAIMAANASGIENGAWSTNVGNYTGAHGVVPNLLGFYANSSLALGLAANGVSVPGNLEIDGNLSVGGNLVGLFAGTLSPDVTFSGIIDNATIQGTISGNAVFTSPPVNGESGFVISQNSITNIAPPGAPTALTIIDSNAANYGVQVYSFSHSGGIYGGWRAEGTAAAPSNTTNGVTLCELGGGGYGTTGWTPGTVAVRLRSDENYTDTAQGSYVGIYTTKNGSNGTTQTLNATFANDGAFILTPPNVTNPTGNFTGISLNTTLQETGTAGAISLLINRTEDGLGSGPQEFLDFQRSSSSVFAIDHSGNVTAGLWNAGIGNSTIATGSHITGNILLNGNLVASIPNVVNSNTIYGISLTNPTTASSGNLAQNSPAELFEANVFYSGANHVFDWSLQASPAPSADGNQLSLVASRDGIKQFEADFQAGASVNGLVLGGDQYRSDGVVLGNGNLSMTGNGTTLYIKTGTNACAGNFTLVNGSALVSTTAITANSTVIFGLATANGTITQAPYMSAVNAGANFTVSSGTGDNSTYNWVIINRQ